MFTTLPPFGFFNMAFFSKWPPLPEKNPENIDQYTCVTFFDDLRGIDYQNHGIWYRYSSKNRFSEKCVGHGNFRNGIGIQDGRHLCRFN